MHTHNEIRRITNQQYERSDSTYPSFEPFLRIGDVAVSGTHKICVLDISGCLGVLGDKQLRIERYAPVPIVFGFNCELERKRFWRTFRRLVLAGRL